LPQPKYKAILEAAEVLGITSAVTQEQIKKKYRELVKQWHPDKCQAAPEECKKMTARITEAYKLILEYIENYKFSFEEEEIRQNLSIDSDGWWFDRFGEDPLWGKPEP